MKLELLEKKEMPLLSTTRMQFLMEFEKATPKREDIVKEVAKKAGSDEKLTIIRHVYTKFGKREAKVIAHVYKSMDDLKRIEEKSMIKKHVKEEPKPEQKPEAAAVEQPKAE